MSSNILCTTHCQIIRLILRYVARSAGFEPAMQGSGPYNGPVIPSDSTTCMNHCSKGHFFRRRIPPCGYLGTWLDSIKGSCSAPPVISVCYILHLSTTDINPHSDAYTTGNPPPSLFRSSSVADQRRHTRRRGTFVWAGSKPLLWRSEI